MLVSRLAKALVRVAVVVVSWWAVGADSSDPHVLGFADALLGGLAEVFVQSLAGNDAAGLGVLIVGLSSQTSRAGSLDNVVSLGTVAFSTVEVVNLIASALYSAQSLVNIIDLSLWALGAEVVD